MACRSETEKLTLTTTVPQGDIRGALKGEQDLEYFIGSGRRGRTFLYQQEGFWFELPD
jgi:hypothetical protein